MTIILNNNIIIKNALLKRNLNLVKIQKCGLMRAGKKATEQAHVVTENKPVTRMFTRAQHTVHYSPKKEENKKNTEPLENWVSPSETVAVSAEVKAQLDKFPVKHPKIVIDADPEKTKHLNITFTHTIPKKSLKEKYEFEVLAEARLGKDPKQPTKDHHMIITNRVLTTTEVNTVPADPELTEYLKSHPDYPRNLKNLVKVALQTLEELGEKNKVSQLIMSNASENTSFSPATNLKKEQPLCFPLPQQKPLQIAPTPSVALSLKKPLLPPVVLPEQKTTSVNEKIRHLAEKPLSVKSTSTNSASGAKNLIKQNNDSTE